MQITTRVKLSSTNIYVFRYRAAGHGKLAIYDRAPLVIPLDIQRKSMLCINVHWIPAAQREPFIKLVLSMAEKTRGGKKLPRLLYDLVKRDRRFKFAMNAIRRYHISNISNLQMVPSELWDGILRVGRYKARFAKKEKGYKI